MMKSVMQKSGCAALCLGVVLAGCSKSDRPVPPVATPVAPQAASNAVVEKPAGSVQSGKPVVTPPMSPRDREAIAKQYPFSDGQTNAPKISNEESMRAAKVRGREFALRVMGEAMAHTQQEMDKIADQMAVAGNAALTTNQAMQATWAVLGEKQAAYDAERSTIPGMADLYKAREAAKTRLKALSAEPNAQGADSAAAADVRAEIRRLGSAMVELELKGRGEHAALQRAVDDLRAAESRHQASLMAMPAFAELAKKHQELSAQYTGLVKRQLDFTKEDRKHE